MKETVTHIESEVHKWFFFFFFVKPYIMERWKINLIYLGSR